MFQRLSQFSNSLDKRFEKLDRTVTRSEQETTRMFYEQKVMLESVLKCLLESKNENHEHFKEVADKLTNMSNDSELFKKEIISSVQKEGKSVNDLVKTESLKTQDDMKSVSEKLNVIGTKSAETPPQKEVQTKKSRWNEPEVLPDLSKPPPSYAKQPQYTPINSSLSYYRKSEQDRRGRSRSRAARDRSRGRSMIRTEHGESSSDASRSSDLGARSRSRAKRTARSPTRDRAKSTVRSPSRNRAKSTVRSRSRSRAKSTARSPSRSRAKSTARSPSRSGAKSTARSPSRSGAKGTARSPSWNRKQAGGSRRSHSRGRTDDERRTVSYEETPADGDETTGNKGDRRRPWMDDRQGGYSGWSSHHYRGNSWKAQGEGGNRTERGKEYLFKK